MRKCAPARPARPVGIHIWRVQKVWRRRSKDQVAAVPRLEAYQYHMRRGQRGFGVCLHFCWVCGVVQEGQLCASLTWRGSFIRIHDRGRTNAVYWVRGWLVPRWQHQAASFWCPRGQRHALVRVDTRVHSDPKAELEVGRSGAVWTAAWPIPAALC